jgi:hypothetical protein
MEGKELRDVTRKLREEARSESGKKAEELGDEEEFAGGTERRPSGCTVITANYSISMFTM